MKTENLSCGKHPELETRYEWLRPGQLKERQSKCPLILFPLGPLEYHGPHMPLGTDPLNATFVAHECCRRLGKGIVLPTMFVGTERERDPDMTEALGFKRDDYVVGMDFPARQWNSHYLPEEVFGLVVAAEVRCLISQGYKYIFIVNGHGAFNHNAVLQRLCIELSNTTPARVDFKIAFPEEAATTGAIGHADIAETSLMMHYNEAAIDLDTLPPNEVPLKYADFSIVDGAGFMGGGGAERVVPREYDPRYSSLQRGKEIFETTISEVCCKIERLIEL
ncbi:MAG: creatininase family protein [Kiritimatiellia bacterium]